MKATSFAKHILNGAAEKYLLADLQARQHAEVLKLAVKFVTAYNKSILYNLLRLQETSSGFTNLGLIRRQHQNRL